MEVSKSQIQSGLVKYIENDVVKSIGDKQVMMIASVFGNVVKNSDSTIDALLENPIVSAIMGKNQNGKYDIEVLYNAIIATLDEYGNFELKIPFLRSPFIFNKEDFKKLKAYIEEG